MNAEHRTEIVKMRNQNYVDIMRTTLFSFAAIGVGTAIDDSYNATLLVLAAAVTAYGVLAGGAALDDIDALRQDMPEDIAATAYGQSVKARNIPMLKMISGGLIGLVGLAAVLSILI